ncbi:hypothetical protein [Sphingomonas japonica]|uniref:Haem-binding uptake Tiki superfamily ChaN domain-containing protein n=1 Tax=Sphingomonas japonica TaxID=511662 RepID=A0ABX0U4J8_9SPHN|nr:hypothetical protein [Sphingomonas japonica]NIJ23717.1 hypothetical protein [Sphingomonas japonica]
MAQDEPTPAEQEAIGRAMNGMLQGRYLDAETLLRPLAHDSNSEPKPGFAYDQWASAVGLLTGEPAPPASPQPLPEDPDIARIETATARNAIAAIVERAQDTRIVILNEDHAAPRHRAFALQVARALRPLGYDVLAVEALSNVKSDAKAAEMMRELARRGYPERETGLYLRDPVFADFIRQSLALGYRPVAYETTSHERSTDMYAAIDKREQAQAEYVVERALKAYPNSKILMHVGFSHATENPQQLGDGEPTRWLATRLKAMTGIDPLTIDQTVLGPNGNGIAALDALTAPRAADGPVVLFDGDRPLIFGSFKGLVDLQVAHPATRWIDGRPHWLTAIGRTPTAIPANLLPESGTRLVQAFLANESEAAIPIDQALVTAGKPLPKLMLSASPVRYAVQEAVPGEPVQTP